MLKSFILAMYIGQKVFGPFRKIQDGFKIDNLCTGSGNGRNYVKAVADNADRQRYFRGLYYFEQSYNLRFYDLQFINFARMAIEET